MANRKLHGPAKLVYPPTPQLRDRVARTVGLIRDAVGSTLGPGGRPACLERPEYGLPPAWTKDGVTVARSLGFPNPLDQAICETVVDAATRTVSEAGDGTTTAIVLTAALTAQVREFCAKNPKISPQRVAEECRRIYAEVLDPDLRSAALKPRIGDPIGDEQLLAVATVSANGDARLAEAVMRAYALCGDAGNVTVEQEPGEYGYAVDRVEGYPISQGWEESTGKVSPLFVNDTARQTVVLERPAVIVYHGSISDPATLWPLLKLAGDLATGDARSRIYRTEGVLQVLVFATSYSESFLKFCAEHWTRGSARIYPLVAPVGPHAGQIVHDVAAVVDGSVLDPITSPCSRATMHDLGNVTPVTVGGAEFFDPGKIRRIEIGRWATTVFGFADDGRRGARAKEVDAQLKQARTTLDQLWTRERLAKITGGIARLRVIGGSTAECRERADRADDAVCAVRAVLARDPDGQSRGALPGGAWALLRLAAKLAPGKDPPYPPVSVRDLLEGEGLEPTDAGTDIGAAVLAPALCDPAYRLMHNAGFSADEAIGIVCQLWGQDFTDTTKAVTCDVTTGAIVLAVEAGLLDAAGAVRGALRHAVSLAGLLGTMGTAVVSARDAVYERQEALDDDDYRRNVEGVNPANER